jgi:hypothetical protein
MAPETANLIPKAKRGGILVITSFIARKLEPQSMDRVIRTPNTPTRFDNTNLWIMNRR